MKLQRKTINEFLNTKNGLHVYRTCGYLIQITKRAILIIFESQKLTLGFCRQQQKPKWYRYREPWELWSTTQKITNPDKKNTFLIQRPFSALQQEYLTSACHWNKCKDRKSINDEPPMKTIEERIPTFTIWEHQVEVKANTSKLRKNSVVNRGPHPEMFSRIDVKDCKICLTRFGESDKNLWHVQLASQSKCLSNFFKSCNLVFAVFG